MTVTWSHNGTDIMTPPNEVVTAGNTTTLVITNLQPSDAGVYQCVFTHSINGWMLRRNTTGSFNSIWLLASYITMTAYATKFKVWPV